MGDLPSTLTFTRGGARITGYPALVDDGDSVSLALLDTEESAEASTRRGVVRLLDIALKDATKQYDKGGGPFSDAAMKLKTAIPADRLLADVLAAAKARAFLADDPLPRSSLAFAEQVKRARARLPAVMNSAFRLVSEIADRYQAVSQRLVAAKAWPRLAGDVRAIRDALVYPGFVSATPWESLTHLPRYLAAQIGRAHV